MISEAALAELSYPEAPRIVTDKIPGPKGQEYIDKALKYESPTRPSASFPLVWDKALGVTIKDVDENIFIDMCAGTAISSVGRCHPKIVEVIKNQSSKLMHSGGDSPSTPRSIELAEKLANSMPGSLRDNCFTAFTQSGGDAVETAIKYAHFITRKSQIIAFEGGYHGVWHGSLALSTNDLCRSGFRPLMPGVIHLPYPYCYRCFADLKYPSCGLACAKYFDYKLNTPSTGADDVAAVIVEPIQGNGGYLEPPLEFFKMVKAACEKKGILFIADEIQSGAGRAGKMWAIEHYGVTPDMIVFGKGIGSDQPISGITVHADFRSKLKGAFQPNSLGNNALSCAVASANIDILTDRDADLMGRAAKIGEEIKHKLAEAARNSEVIGEVRGKGFMIGIELVKNKETREPLSQDKMANIRKIGWARGILLSSCGRNGNIIRIMPSLVITKAYFEEGTDIFLDILREDEADLVK